MKTLKFNAGEVIFREGDASREAYRILSGKVDISVETPGGGGSVGQLREGEIFGEMGLVDEQPRSATATALEATELTVIDEENFPEAILGDAAALEHYLSTLVERLRTTDTLLKIALRRQQEAAVRPADAIPTMEHALRPVPAVAGRSDLAATGETAREFRVLLTSAYEPTVWRGDQVAVEVDKFPFRIGCQFLGPPPPFGMNDLLVRDTVDQHISRNHCAIERNAESVLVRDRGSTTGTIVNGTALGVKEGVITSTLEPGENVIILGGVESPHRFFIHVEVVANC